MSPLDAPKACHQTRMQLSNIMCDRELTKEEKILHNIATRFMIRILTMCEKRMEEANAAEDKANENPPGIPDDGSKEIPPGEEPGLLSQ